MGVSRLKISVTVSTHPFVSKIELPSAYTTYGCQNPNSVIARSIAGAIVGGARPQVERLVPSHTYKSAGEPSEKYVTLPMVLMKPWATVVLERMVVSDVSVKTAKRCVVSTKADTCPFKLRLE